MAEQIKIVQMGCGPIGCSVVRLLSTKPGIAIAGAADLDNAGRDLGEVAEAEKTDGITISDDINEVLSAARPDAVVHTTGSSLEQVFPQLESVIKTGANIVSTCEELSYPFGIQPELSAKIDELARKHKVTVLGTGINPGFLMDAWPLFMTAICQHVDRVRAVRIQDASKRRIPFQQKIGAGRTPDEFQGLVDSGKIKHVGLPESAAMIAAGLGWELDDITETIEPVIAGQEVSSDYLTVKAGQASGVRQVAHGTIDGEAKITLEFQACIGAGESYDAVYISGSQDVEVVIKNGTHGDLATAAMVVNSIPRVVEAPPGLITMKDLPIVSALPSD
jgi:4-hydroxy-tetrahydrodipicolinate reductase